MDASNLNKAAEDILNGELPEYRAALFSKGTREDLEFVLQHKYNQPREIVSDVELVLCRSIVAKCRELSKTVGECLAKKLSKWLMS